MKKYAIIVAGGKGTRMGANLPKQFMLLKGMPLLYYTIRTFLDAFDDLEIILVLPGEHVKTGQKIVTEYFDKANITITTGGDTRFQSVKNGLALVKEESVIFVHDGVRCLLTKDLIHRCYQTASEKGTAIPSIQSKDSLRMISREGNEILDRNAVQLVQTPQTFQSNIIIPAFHAAEYNEKFTDEATVVEAKGIEITLIEGEENNIKITTSLDMLIAEKILEESR